MSVADMIALRVASLTNQQLADMALAADQEARQAYRRGDMATYRKRDLEAFRLLQFVRN